MFTYPVQLLDWVGIHNGKLEGTISFKIGANMATGGGEVVEIHVDKSSGKDDGASEDRWPPKQNIEIHSKIL